MNNLLDITIDEVELLRNVQAGTGNDEWSWVPAPAPTNEEV
jgi:hypothetical protein